MFNRKSKKKKLNSNASCSSFACSMSSPSISELLSASKEICPRSHDYFNACFNSASCVTLRQLPSPPKDMCSKSFDNLGLCSSCINLRASQFKDSSKKKSVLDGGDYRIGGGRIMTPRRDVKNEVKSKKSQVTIEDILSATFICEEDDVDDESCDESSSDVCDESTSDVCDESTSDVCDKSSDVCDDSTSDICHESSSCCCDEVPKIPTPPCTPVEICEPPPKKCPRRRRKKKRKYKVYPCICLKYEPCKPCVPTINYDMLIKLLKKYTGKSTVIKKPPADHTHSFQVDPNGIRSLLKGVNIDSRKKSSIEVSYKPYKDTKNDVFLVKLGTKEICERNQHSVEIELKTPKIPRSGLIPKCTRETQIKETELYAALRGRKGKKKYN